MCVVPAKEIRLMHTRIYRPAVGKFVPVLPPGFDPRLIGLQAIDRLKELGYDVHPRPARKCVMTDGSFPWAFASFYDFVDSGIAIVAQPGTRLFIVVTRLLRFSASPGVGARCEGDDFPPTGRPHAACFFCGADFWVDEGGAPTRLRKAPTGPGGDIDWTSIDQACNAGHPPMDNDLLRATRRHRLDVERRELTLAGVWA